MPHKNLNTSGRMIRLICAVALLALAWSLSSWLVLAASLFVFYEALASWCVLYQFLGKNSCPLDKR